LEFILISPITEAKTIVCATLAKSREFLQGHSSNSDYCHQQDASDYSSTYFLSVAYHNHCESSSWIVVGLWNVVLYTFRQRAVWVWISLELFFGKWLISMHHELFISGIPTVSYNHWH